MVNELVDRMCEAHVTALGARWSDKDDHTLARMGMTAALRVAADAAVDALLCKTDTLGKQDAIDAIRARLEAPAKTAEERVTVRNEDQEWRVYRDDRYTGIHFGIEGCAKIYRLGLIATLKEGKQ